MADDRCPGTDDQMGESSSSGRRVLDLLADEQCLALLRALIDGEHPLTVPALVERSDVAESTAYRKLRRLREAGLVRDRRRLDGDGRCSRTYEADVTRVTVGVDGDGVDVRIAGEGPGHRATARGDD